MNEKVRLARRIAKGSRMVHHAPFCTELVVLAARLRLVSPHHLEEPGPRWRLQLRDCVLVCALLAVLDASFFSAAFATAAARYAASCKLAVCACGVLLISFRSPFLRLYSYGLT